MARKKIRLNSEQAGDLYRAGQHMSNWLYNQAQNDHFKQWADDMKQMVREWDAVARNLMPPRIAK